MFDDGGDRDGNVIVMVMVVADEHFSFVCLLLLSSSSLLLLLLLFGLVELEGGVEKGEFVSLPISYKSPLSI